MGYTPSVIIVVGDPGVGKTSLLNGWANYGGEAGDDDYAGVTAWKDVQVKPGPKLSDGTVVRVVDTPGLGGPKGKLTVWLANLLDIMAKQAMNVAGIVLLADGCLPRITMSSHLMTQIVPQLINTAPDKNPWDRIVIAVSKCNMDSSIYRKKGPDAVRDKLYLGLQAADAPRLNKFDRRRDIVFCGLKGEAPEYNGLMARVSAMCGDKKQPALVTDKPKIVKVVQNAMAEVTGPMVDGQPVSVVANNMVEDAVQSSPGSCKGGC